jgi:hypothetical protein
MKSQTLLHLLRKTTLMWLALVCGATAMAQTSNISGIVNSYYSVTEVVTTKNCVRVGNTAGLSAGMKILLVQMKGASVVGGSASDFGNITSLNNAGNYEVGYVCYTNGDSVFLVHSILNSYTPVSGKVQLVRFAEYQNAIVTDTIKARQWSNATGTGGVIAISIVDNLTLNAPIYADSLGYIGGQYVQTGNSCTNSVSSYVYNPTSTILQNGAYKGEGVAEITTTQNGGRGAPANGGGGGNNHNNSGGGGANLSAGGLGGGNSSNTGSGCYATFRGEGGKALSSFGGTKIFMGGGGGAGHNNGGFGTNPSFGGDGGGIIFITANTIDGNARRISANGGRGGNSISDGAGGSGAGGTIILDVNTFTGSLIVSACGAQGGTADDGGNLNKCFGGGGGGSGGAIYFKIATPAGVNIYDTAGAAGLEIGRHNPSCAAPQPAFAGSAGFTIPNYTPRISSTLSGSCGVALPARLIYFKAKLVQQKVQLSWRILNPELIDRFIVQRLAGASGWQTLATINANDNTELYASADADPLRGDNLYRIKIIEKNLSAYYSPSRLILIADQPGAFSIYPNPASDKITVTGNFSNGTDLLLFGMNGKKLLQRKLISNITDITLPALTKGIYMIRIDETTQKLVIQ